MTKRKRMHNQRTAKAVERKALALDAPSIPVPLMSDEQRLRIERRSVLDRTCYSVDVPAEPRIMSLAHVQHLHTPASAQGQDPNSDTIPSLRHSIVFLP